MSAAPAFPPLFRGQEAADPPSAARQMAGDGCDAGTVLYSFAGGDLSAAVVFAPEVPLAEAAEMIPVAAVGLQNALGALAPPEVAVHLAWDGGIRVNGALTGRIGCLAPTAEPAALPDWLIITLRIDFLPPVADTGATPERTALYSEGCGEVTPTALLEAWIRHMLLWTTRWMDGEQKALHREYTGVLHDLHGPANLAGKSGELIGVDEHFSFVFKAEDGITSIPQTTLVRSWPAASGAMCPEPHAPCG